MAYTPTTFTRDGEVAVAYSISDAVRLRYDGWTEEGAAELEPLTQAVRTINGKTGPDVTLSVDDLADFNETIGGAVEDAYEDYAPGASMGTATVATSLTSTATAYPGNILPGLAVTVIGKGRPVEVKLTAAGVYHTTANAASTLVVVANGGFLSSDGNLGSHFSPSVTAGPPVNLSREVILLDGVPYTFTIGAYGSVAGTVTLLSGPYCPIQLAVIAR